MGGGRGEHFFFNSEKFLSYTKQKQKILEESWFFRKAKTKSGQNWNESKTLHYFPGIYILSMWNFHKLPTHNI